MLRLAQGLRRFVGTPPAGATIPLVTEYNEPGSAVWHRTGFMHRQRYAFASRHVRSKRVLNVACGPGYAEEILMMGQPTSVVAVDYDKALIARLQAGVPDGSRIDYRHADAEDLPDSLGKFEVIVSLENIEHLREPERFLSHLARLALPEAQLILSTPNRLKYRDHPERPFKNPFHVREYDFQELTALLDPYLSNIDAFGQVEREYMAVVDELGSAIRSFNSLWTVRLERAIRQFIGRPLRPLSQLPFETDLVPIAPEVFDQVDTFVVIGTIR